jgi:hypothetical protein
LAGREESCFWLAVEKVKFNLKNAMLFLISYIIGLYTQTIDNAVYDARILLFTTWRSTSDKC